MVLYRIDVKPESAFATTAPNAHKHDSDYIYDNDRLLCYRVDYFVPDSEVHVFEQDIQNNRCIIKVEVVQYTT